MEIALAPIEITMSAIITCSSHGDFACSIIHRP
jgi:hypothetical protein